MIDVADLVDAEMDDLLMTFEGCPSCIQEMLIHEQTTVVAEVSAGAPFTSRYGLVTCVWCTVPSDY